MKYFVSCFIFLLLVPAVKAQTQSQPAAPPSTDIYLIRLENGKMIASTVLNITKRKGYDNQPSFLPDSKKLFYTSIREDEQADTFLYDVGDATAKKITNTAESEYSPTLTPDGQFFSTVRVEKDGTQRLWKFPLSGGSPSLILEQVKPVGYHAWIDPHRVALFILGEPPTLQIADIRSGNSSVIASNVGRSLHKVPGGNRISFVQKLTEQTGTIKEYDPETRETRDVMALLPETEDYNWTPGGLLITAKGSKLYTYDPVKDKDWKEVLDLSASRVGKITRIAVSPDSKWVAIVAEES